MSRHQPVSPFERSVFHRQGSAGALRFNAMPSVANVRAIAPAAAQSPGPRFSGVLFDGEPASPIAPYSPIPAYRVDNPLSGRWEYSKMLLNPGWIALMGNNSPNPDTFRLRAIGYVPPSAPTAQWISLPAQWQQLLVYSGGGPWPEPGVVLQDPRELPIGFVRASF